ncbi:MAG: nicotinate-nucleotide--dimethylbenzimidazole phosphoribosyltransferase [Actinobacteria bacterium]|nr:nicotinate-nucleotide--dimethylbenzimidazole phosphoribosyltransferase [Actinomycetota bacterium]
MTEPGPSVLRDALDGIDYPDDEAGHAARRRQDQLTKPAGALGMLEELSIWASGVQGRCPPHAFERTRVVVFAGDHGVAEAGVSAYPAEVTAQMVANIAAGGAAVNVLARAAGAGVRVVDLSVATDTDPAVSAFKVRRSSGRIDREDALSPAETAAALAAGAAIADAEIDGGAQLLIAGDMGIGNTTPASVLISVLTGTEPIKVVGRGTGIDDAGWIRKCAAVRDARRRAWPHRDDPARLLATAGGADLAAMTGFLLQAALRRTPVLLDGLVVSAAALVAQLANPRVVHWMRAAHLSAEPAHELALQRLELVPILLLEMRLGEGTGALVALPVLRAAALTLAEMATFAEAAVSDRDQAADRPIPNDAVPDDAVPVPDDAVPDDAVPEQADREGEPGG